MSHRHSRSLTQASRIPFRSGVFALATALVAACGSSTETPADTGGLPADTGSTTNPDATTEADAGSRPDAARTDTGPRDSGPAPDSGVVVGDGNDSFAEAVELTIGNGAGATAAIERAGDKDYFKITGTEGAFVLISAASTAVDPVLTDTVITLYDSTMTKVAENDDALPRNGTNSEVVYHLAAATTYYLEVQEFSSWTMGGTPVGGAAFTYRVSALPLVDASNGIVVDQEAGNDAASARNVDFGRTTTFILGTFASGSDVDVFRLVVTGGDQRIFTMEVMPDGPAGYGSTSPVGEIWLTDATGATVLSRVDSSAGLLLAPPTRAGTYLLWIKHPSTALGANDYYVVKPTFAADNPPEAGDPTNDTLAGAEAIPLTESSTSARSGFVLATLPVGDVDWFSFDILTGETVAVGCGSATAGSGIRDLTAAIVDHAGTVLATETETLTDGLGIPATTVTSTGTYYLKLTRGAQDPVVTSDFVRCGVHTEK